MPYAPIVLFVYNRPEHTARTVEALKANAIASQSDLFVFSDAAKTDTDQPRVDQVRSYIGTIEGFKSVSVFESKENKGLSRSIIGGVTQILGQFDRVIVLEDDLECSPFFLEYMNDSLEIYGNEPLVGCIHGWNHLLDTTGFPEKTFFLPGADCWGWATWKRDWELFESDGAKLLDELLRNKLEFSFNRRNTMPYIQMLRDQIAGKNDSWAIRWHASLFLKGKFCLHPVRSLVRNIGLDGSGTHCDDVELPQLMGEQIPPKRIEILESEWFFRAYNLAQAKPHHPQKPIWRRLLQYLRS